MTEIPGYIAGEWDVDAVHSEVSFTVKHMMVSKVRGRFDKFEGTIVTGEKPEQSSVTASIDANSINTNNEQRDGHIRSADFFEVDKHPTWKFASSAVRDVTAEGFKLDGSLTVKGVSKPVTFDVELNGIGPDAYGGTRIGFSAEAVINRGDFGVDFNGPIPGAANGVILGDKVTVNLEIEGVLKTG
ncbi:MAG: YceI family protein [Actinomycetia bacterium]|jgi:polyisoprenoid-binding protein YceI|nr:YceI family protein [Actinomycetes bacterium]